MSDPETLVMKAEQGDAEPQHCSDDVGGEEAEESGLRWYRQEAEKGHVYAQSALAMIYTRGFGVERNEEIAKEWIQKAATNPTIVETCRQAAEQGNAKA